MSLLLSHREGGNSGSCRLLFSKLKSPNALLTFYSSNMVQVLLPLATAECTGDSLLLSLQESGHRTSSRRAELCCSPRPIVGGGLPHERQRLRVATCPSHHPRPCGLPQFASHLVSAALLSLFVPSLTFSFNKVRWEMPQTSGQGPGVGSILCSQPPRCPLRRPILTSPRSLIFS